MSRPSALQLLCSRLAHVRGTLTRPPPRAGLPIGVPSYLLVSLANLGPKMFNVTKINGVVSDVKTGKSLANFTRRMYGEPLGPREQRSFRYPFAPSKKLSPGEYQLSFSIFYANRDKTPFASVVYNEKNVLVRAPPALPRGASPRGAEKQRRRGATHTTRTAHCEPPHRPTAPQHPNTPTRRTQLLCLRPCVRWPALRRRVSSL